MLKQRKEEIAADLRERLQRAQVVILTDYKGLNVSAMTDLRRRLQEAGVEYQVVKNTLLERAAADTDVAVIREHFTGPSAIALSEGDPVAAAKVLTQFAKGNGKLEIRVGMLDGRPMAAADIQRLADLPSREVLLAQVLGALQAVPASLVRTLAAVPGQFVNVLNAIKEKQAA